MNEKSIGSFLSALRKANGYTQQQVADSLCVSNKTVSKWERGDGYPEITMLPAIAELYGVTVDEILKGERITKNSSEKEVEKKTEERTKLIIEKTELRFKNYSIVAVALGFISCLLSPFISINLHEPVYVVALVFVFLMTVASVITAFIARNNYLSALKSDETEIADINSAKAKINILLAFEGVFTVTTIVTGISGFIYGATPFAYWCLTLIVTSAVALITCLALNSKTDGENNPQIQKLRKKILNTTIVIVSVIIVLNAIAPFAMHIVGALSPIMYRFTDAVGYDYETQDEAINDYYVLKAYFTEGRDVYRVYEYSTEKGNCSAYTEKFIHRVSAKNDGYIIDEYRVTDLIHYFDSPQETEQFLQNNTISVGLEHILESGCRITFDDKSYTVTAIPVKLYKVFENVTDILPIFALVASACCLCVFVADAIIYGAKKKKLK